MVMADSDIQTSTDEAGKEAARAAHKAGDAVKTGADAVAGAVEAGVAAERRSFAEAGEAGRQSAAALSNAAQISLKAGQEMARRAGDQAADLWRNSLTPMAQMMSNEFTHWVEQAWRRASGGGMRGGFPMAVLAPFTGHPLADLRETDHGFELCVDLPGLKPEEITLVVRGGALVVSGEKAAESEGVQGGYRFSERRFGRFERTFDLPPGADREGIDATFENGVLRIQIPAAPDGEPTVTIPVKG
jgi:HSP20 family protein